MPYSISFQAIGTERGFGFSPGIR